VLAVALPVLWACNARRLQAPQAAPQRVANNTFQETLNRDLDIVFMVDNSLSMQPLINKLTRNFPAFIQVLQNLPNGLPNVHIGVVSSSMGAGATTNVPNCAQGGDGGNFQDQVGVGTSEMGGIPCTKTGLNANQHFISSVNGTQNFDTTFQASPMIPAGIASVFSCIASLGDQGCGFEHQLASVARALSKDDMVSADGNPVPGNNTGFLRPSAYLAIIFITNEDDCSAPPDSGLFDTSSRYVADPLGPLWSYRCNEYGHLCDGMPPSRTMMYSYGPGECVPAEEKGQLIPVHTLVEQIKGLKSDPSLIFVAAIAGPPDPYSMTPIPPQLPNDPSMWPNIDHSCTTPNTNPPEYGDPSIRLKAFVDAFGANGLFESICANTFAPALMTIAQTLSRVLGPKCIIGQPLDKNGQPTTDGPAAANTPQGTTQTAVGADCSVVEHSFDPSGMEVNTILPSCQDNPNTKCWNLDVNPGTQTMPVCPALNMGATPSHVLDLNPPPDPTTSGLNVSVSCSIQAN
jgi:hypothetical protein